ncbi:kinase-like domain-containing protein, partial [Thamnocephalis sphaerospora]
SPRQLREICVLAMGEFGKIKLMYGPESDRPLAVKTLSKQYLLRRGDQACYMEERDALVANRGNRWIPQLEQALQDEEFLHLVMEYAPGGDLLGLLARQEHAVISEADARFYMAELIMALHTLHQTGFVHRDVKPGNVLIAADGHVKLADFGSCARMGPSGLVLSSVSVGTPDYVSPEVLRAQENAGGTSATYGCECDWWSVGVLLYECLYGDPPFAGDTLLDTYNRVMHHQRYLVFPDDEDVEVSDAAKDLIRRLLCDRETRIGLSGVEEIQQHPFFAGVNWEQLHTSR